MEQQQHNLWHVKPAPGSRVRDPRTREVLPQEGAHVEPSTFWRSRLADGSVQFVAPEGNIERIVEESTTQNLTDPGNTRKPSRPRRHNAQE